MSIDRQVYVKYHLATGKWFIVSEIGDKAFADRYLWADGTWHPECRKSGEGFYAELDDAYDALRALGINDYIVVQHEGVTP